MNRFKEELTQQLQSLSLSEEKKKQIATKAKAKTRRQQKWINWQYRVVLSAFTIFVLGFGYLLWQQQGDGGNQSQSAVLNAPVTTPNGFLAIINNDLSKAILLIGFFIILRTFMKKRFLKRGGGLPHCTECGEEWSYGEALKKSMKNGVMTCPHCSQKQYRTKKSLFRGGMLNMLMPFVVIAPLLFDRSLVGFIIYALCAVYLIVSLSPYYIELQKNDNITEPLW